MGQPYPPQGQQKQYTERPIKVYGEQYLDGQPLPVGVVIGPGGPPDLTEAARVQLPDGAVVITFGDWLLSNRYTGQPTDVISAEEFAERFGGPADVISGA